LNSLQLKENDGSLSQFRLNQTVCVAGWCAFARDCLNRHCREQWMDVWYTSLLN